MDLNGLYHRFGKKKGPLFVGFSNPTSEAYQGVSEINSPRGYGGSTFSRNPRVALERAFRRAVRENGESMQVGVLENFPRSFIELRDDGSVYSERNASWRSHFPVQIYGEDALDAFITHGHIPEGEQKKNTERVLVDQLLLHDPQGYKTLLEQEENLPFLAAYFKRRGGVAQLRADALYPILVRQTGIPEPELRKAVSRLEFFRVIEGIPVEGRRDGEVRVGAVGVNLELMEHLTNFRLLLENLEREYESQINLNL